LRGFFSILVDVFDHAFENQQIGAAFAGELDAIAVVPLDGAAEDFAIIEDHGHGRVGLHLLDPVEVLRMSELGRRRLFAGNGAVVRGTLEAGLLEIRKSGTKHPAIHHNYSFSEAGVCSGIEMHADGAGLQLEETIFFFG